MIPPQSAAVHPGLTLDMQVISFNILICIYTVTHMYIFYLFMDDTIDDISSGKFHLSTLKTA